MSKSTQSKQINISNRETQPLVIYPNSENPPNIVDIIVPLSKAIITDAYGDERAFKFIKYYYALEGSRAYTLQAIADGDGLSKERIRQVNQQTLQRIKAILLDGHNVKGYCAPRKVVEEAGDLLEIMQDREAILLESEIQSIIEHRYGQRVSSQKFPDLKFLLNVFGFKELLTKPPGYSGSDIKGWQISPDFEIHKLWQALISIYKELLSEIRSLSGFELKMLVNRRRKQQIEDKYIFCAVRICPDIEVTSDNKYQMRIERLVSLADQAYRILFEKGHPMHAREIVKELNHRLVLAGFPGSAHHRSMTGQMRPPRFEPIGGTGTWKLAEWDHVHTQTTVKIMIEFFHLNKESATVNEVYAYVLKKRPDVPRQSVAVYLSTKKDVFTKVLPSKYALAEWGGKPEPSLPRGESFASRLASEIKDIFSRSSEPAMPLSQLVRELKKRVNTSPNNIYVALNQLSIIETELYPGQQRRKLVKYVGNDGQSSLVPLKKTKMQAVQEEIANYLSKQPSGEVAVAELAEHIPKITGCSKPTFYGYLSKMKNVKKVNIGGKLYCYLDKATDSNSSLLNLPQLSQIADIELRESMIRAISLLQLDTVDVGLIDLGRIFENELKKLLLLAQEKNTFPVSRKDLGRLVDMIDCVAREGVIQKKHHLTLLREERNTGAHGKIPDKKEREDIMQSAPFLAGLYINYIIIFYKERLRIGNSL